MPLNNHRMVLSMQGHRQDHLIPDGTFFLRGWSHGNPPEYSIRVGGRPCQHLIPIYSHSQSRPEKKSGSHPSPIQYRCIAE